MVFQSIGGRNSIVVPGRLENAGLFEPMCSKNVGLGLGRFHNARGYQPFWKPIEAKRTAPVRGLVKLEILLSSLRADTYASVGTSREEDSTVTQIGSFGTTHSL
ncbi:hypothetical protein PCASD_03263 [Puccinia coronata f. sp. avenae]|uniref:Uncharacterized protein n=1 Tax=Puccinia coronata f. sp. avenae TaxID=200324 RepID=A0A2N5SZJ1_9BASI|nr:hypothetical protein PCASD_18595 [Puccinia coronata f. sp. avenae]PLW48218.1 hypothetical protein PCASD_03263 [Puccinia coronata f. sp. avenae]